MVNSGEGSISIPDFGNDEELVTLPHFCSIAARVEGCVFAGWRRKDGQRRGVLGIFFTICVVCGGRLEAT